MSNLKKVLAMVLAVAMLLSMGLTAGAGKFADVKDTDSYARAINLLASLNVLKGFDDGTYNAAGTYTREQFAKILYVLMNGKDDGASIYSGVSPFADVAADRWSAGYINWAKNAKVIAGREDGLFWPTDIVTYAEAAKMFIVAMGYDSTVYTFPYGFIDKAQTMKLFDDVSGMTANGPANRGTVAQMAFNALFADAPRFGSFAAQIGTSSATETRFKTVAEGAFGMEEATTELLATSTKALDKTSFNDKGQVNLAACTGSAKTELSAGAYDYDGNVDNYVGSDVVIWFRPAQSAAGTGVDTEEKIFDIQPSASNRIYDFTFADINDDDTTATKLVASIGGADKKLDYGHGTDVITLEGDDGLYADDLFYDANDVTTGLQPSGLHSDKYRAIDRDNDGEIDLFIVERTSTAKLTSLSSSRVTLSNKKGAEGFTGSKDIKDEDVVQVVVGEGIAKNDYVVVSGTMQYTEEGYKTVYTLAKATKLEGTKLKTASSGSYYFDGTKYKAANEASVSFTTADVGNKYDIVLDVNGRIVFCEKTQSAVTSDKWFFATEYLTSRVNGVDRLTSITGYLADGTKKTYPVDSEIEVNGEEIDRDNGTEPCLNDGDALYGYNGIADEVVYKFGTNSSGEIDELFTLPQVLADNDDDYTAVLNAKAVTAYSTSTNVLKADGTSYTVEDDTVVYVMYGTEKYKAFAGSELKKFDSDDDDWDITGLVNSDKEYAVMLLDVTGSTAPKKTTDTYGMLMKVEKESTDNDEYVYTFYVYYDGKLNEIKSDSIDADDDFDDLVSSKICGIYKITFTAAGLVDDVAEATVGTDYDNIVISDVRSSALIGNTVASGNFVASGNSSVKFKLDDSPALGDMDFNDLADALAVYQIDDYPIAKVGNDVATGLDNDVDVTVTDVSALEESDSELSYIATVIYNVDDKEISDIFYYSSPVESSDKTAPEFAAGYPDEGNAQAAGSKLVEVLVKSNENATAYYVSVANGAAAPTATDVKAGSSVAVTAGVEKAFTMALAADATEYDVYVILVDANNNESTVEMVDVTTPAAA